MWIWVPDLFPHPSTRTELYVSILPSYCQDVFDSPQYEQLYADAVTAKRPTTSTKASKKATNCFAFIVESLLSTFSSRKHKACLVLISRTHKAPGRAGDETALHKHASISFGALSWPTLAGESRSAARLPFNCLQYSKKAL